MQTDETLLSALNAALSTLPPLCRRAFILVRFEGKTAEEAAAQMRIPAEQARMLACRAFIHVQNKLGSLANVAPAVMPADKLRLRIEARVPAVPSATQGVPYKAP